MIKPNFFIIGAAKCATSSLASLLDIHPQAAIGDASTSYSRIRQNPNTIRRIYDFAPEAKIIYMLRHPLERIESAYSERLMMPNCPHKESLTNRYVRCQ